MQLTIVALLILAGFAAGVIFSGLIRVFIDKQLHGLYARSAALEQYAKAETDHLRARVVELEQKVKSLV